MGNTKRHRGSKPKADPYEVLRDFVEDEMSTEELARKYDYTLPGLSSILTKLLKKIMSRREVSLLTEGKAHQVIRADSHPLKQFNRMRSMTQEFLELVSKPNAELTAEEEAFVAIGTRTGDWETALAESGLAVGLVNERRVIPTDFRSAATARIVFLKDKPNIRGAEKLRKTYYSTGVKKLSKEYIQATLLEEIEQMRMTGKNRREILQAITKLGESIGAFTKKVEIGEIDPEKALKEMTEMAKNAEGVYEVNDE